MKLLPGSFSPRYDGLAMTEKPTLEYGTVNRRRARWWTYLPIIAMGVMGLVLLGIGLMVLFCYW